MCAGNEMLIVTPHIMTVNNTCPLAVTQMSNANTRESIWLLSISLGPMHALLVLLDIDADIETDLKHSTSCVCDVSYSLPISTVSIWNI